MQTVGVVGQAVSLVQSVYTKKEKFMLNIFSRMYIRIVRISNIIATRKFVEQWAVPDLSGKQSVGRSATLLCLLLLMGTNTGCKSVSEFHTYKAERSSVRSYDGVRQMLEQSNLNIVFVHGMGDFSQGDPKQVIDHLVTELDLKFIKAEPIQQVRYENVLVGLIKDSLFQHDESGNSVRFKQVDWSLSTNFVKQSAFEFDNDNLDKRGSRLPRHSKIKQLQNSSLGDVALYLSPTFRPRIQEASRVAIRQIGASLSKESEKQTRTIVIAYSLGSRIVFDIMDASMNKGGQKEFVAFTASVDRFFMLANQLSLLGLAIDGKEGKLESYPYFFKNDTNQSSKDEKQFKIIAITDPNDHLSFRIEKALFDSPIGDQILDVDCTVAKKAYLIPGIGWMINPVAAHTHYGRTKKVLNLITDGYTIIE